jgi:ubiquinol-cytochrome c reductase cytochrome b subunit
VDGRSPSTVGFVGLALAFLALAALSGLLLALGYDADPDEAHASVAGMPPWLRGVHSWAATAALALLLLHLAQAALRGWDEAQAEDGRKRWLLGVAALAAVLAVVLTGSVLSWDHQGWLAFRHLHEALESMGLRGPGTDSPGGTPLTAVLLAHVAGAALVLALAWPLRTDGGVDRDLDGIRLRPRHFATALAAVVALAAVLPQALGPPPQASAPGGRPEWPFIWLVPLEDAWGIRAVLALPPLLGLLAAAPWFAARWPARRRTAALVACASILLVLSLLTLR